MGCLAKCFYRDDKVPGDGRCFLNHPGPMEVCGSYKPPTALHPAPLDEEMRKRFKEAGL